MNAEILAHLSRNDPVLERLIRAVGPCRLEPPELCHPFQVLARAIAHQQLNGTAANTILKRLVENCGKGAFPSPQMLLDAPVESLRAAGFSFAKVAALRDLATKSLSAVVPEHAALLPMTDAEIIERLTAVRGIGRWTVEMLLIFQLGRPDVLPVDDFGVRAGFQAAYGLRRMPPPKVLAAYGERWKPYRTTVAWYLWRAVELKRAGTLPAPAERIRLPRLKKRRKAKTAAKRRVRSGTHRAKPSRGRRAVKAAGRSTRRAGRRTRRAG
jgi:DNA-3-methyladenine glycosylase II